MLRTLCLPVVVLPLALRAQPANPLWREAKVRNYLPHMAWPEVQDLLTRTDMVILPIASLEQHALHLPIGTDYLNGIETAKLIAQKSDVLIAPILMPGSSPYHMDFPGTITLKPETITEVYLEAAQSLIHHGFRRFMLLNTHGGNQYITKYIVDRVNQETEGIAVDLDDASRPFLARGPGHETPAGPPVFDRHGGVGETSNALFLFPSLVNMKNARTATRTMPEHMQKMLPLVAAGDPTASLVFLAEGLKPKGTGKKTFSSSAYDPVMFDVKNVMTMGPERA